jgi:hypothetical protein
MRILLPVIGMACCVSAQAQEIEYLDTEPLHGSGMMPHYYYPPPPPPVRYYSYPPQYRYSQTTPAYGIPQYQAPRYYINPAPSGGYRRR